MLTAASIHLLAEATMVDLKVTVAVVGVMKNNLVVDVGEVALLTAKMPRAVVQPAGTRAHLVAQVDGIKVEIVRILWTENCRYG